MIIDKMYIYVIPRYATKHVPVVVVVVVVDDDVMALVVRSTRAFGWQHEEICYNFNFVRSSSLVIIISNSFMNLTIHYRPIDREKTAKKKELTWFKS